MDLGSRFFLSEKKKANYQKVKKEKKTKPASMEQQQQTTLFFVYRSWIVCPENSWKSSRGGARQENE